MPKNSTYGRRQFLGQITVLGVSAYSSLSTAGICNPIQGKATNDSANHDHLFEFRQSTAVGDHMEDFEIEKNFSQMCADLMEYHPELRFSAIHHALAQIAPSYINALHERKCCIRKLKFIGCTWCPETPPTDDKFFKLGQMYVGTSSTAALMPSMGMVTG